MRINRENIEELLIEVFIHCGCQHEEATVVAHNLVLTEMCGLASHGLRMVSAHADKYRSSVYQYAKPLEIEVETNAFARINANGMCGLYSATRCMEFAIDKCNEWINGNIGTLMRKYNISDERVFRSYLTMYLLMHETERMYLHLMGKGYIPSPCETVKGSYSIMNELILTPSLNPVKQVRRVVSLIPYNKHPERYIFERNANVETYSGLLSLAADEGNKEMAVLYRGLATKSMLVGYEQDNKGCLYHTFKDLMMLDYYDKINKKEKMDPNDAARFGLEIPEETRKKMLTRK